MTFAEFDAFTQATGYKSAPDYETWGRGSHPVINVSWEDAQAYIDWLSKTTGRSYRLPSEAEWEYAARAGTTTAYSWGDDFEHYNQANCYGCNREWLMSTTPVGSFEANKFGLYDMAGNVSEWTQDCLNMDYHGAPSDGSAWESGDCQRRITRGGGWDTIPLFLRPANRGGRVKFAAKKRFDFLGFRVAMDLDKK